MGKGHYLIFVTPKQNGQLTGIKFLCQKNRVSKAEDNTVCTVPAPQVLQPEFSSPEPTAL